MRSAPPQAGGGVRPLARGARALSSALAALRAAAPGLLLAALLLLPALGAGPLERAEIYFLDAARAMVETGDVLVPRYRGEAFFDKPVLSYWLMAAAFHGFGPGPGAARLVSVTAALGVVLATALLGLRLFGARAGRAAALVLATSLTFVSFGRIAMSDMLLTLFTTGAVALGAELLWPPEGRAKPGVLAGLGLALGLGFATKGPVAWLMAGIPLALLAGRARASLRSRLPPTGLLAGTLLLVGAGGAWFVALYLRLGSEPLAYFFLKENLERFAGEAYDVGRPFWYYPPAYLLTGLPWSFALLPALARVRRNDASALLTAWILVALVPLSLSRGKLDYYLLPLYPAIALLVGRWLTEVGWTALDRGAARGLLALAAAGFAGLAFLPGRLDPSWLPSPTACALLALVSAAGVAACLWAAHRPSPRRLLFTLALATASVGVILVSAFLPAFRAAQPNRRLAQAVARERAHRPDLRVVACADPARVERDVLFEARVPVERRCDLWDVAPAHQPFLFLLDREEFASLSGVPGFREVARYRYLPAATLTLSGLLSPRPPGLVILAANFPTGDPVAELRRKKLRKQALREEAEGPTPPE